VGTVRESPGAKRQIVLGMPANQMDLQAYARFLSACAKDPRFNADTLIEAMQKEGGGFSLLDRVGYRLFVIGRVQRAILERDKENAWFDTRPPFGVGRVDTFNPYKVMFHLTIDSTVGTVDLPSLWNQRVRQGMWLHWDGNNNLVDERNKSAAIGAGATPSSLDVPSLDRVAKWALDLQPPPFPRSRVDASRLDEGRRVYDAQCARCHDPRGERVGQVTPLAEIGTDPERLHSFTAELAGRMNTIGDGYPWKFSHFRKTDGYANMPLDGLWLRAPYLHNGSVPTLRALLEPDRRPATFHRAYDVYDWRDVGFVSSGADAQREGVLFDTSVRGNANKGHTYGADLPAPEKDALLEYLKTL
jgi:mono/diheme cytochrome c family protein